MRTEFVFVAIIAFLIVVIVILSISLLEPAGISERELTFNDIIELSAERRASVESISMVYEVNLSSVDGEFIGELNYTRYGERSSYRVSPWISEFAGTALLLSPDDVIDFILFNNREEYSGLLKEGNRSCWSTITEPNSTSYSKLIDGDYVFVTCFDQVTGYPIVVYAGEVAGEEVVYSKLSVKNITYELL